MILASTSAKIKKALTNNSKAFLLYIYSIKIISLTARKRAYNVSSKEVKSMYIK